MCVGAFPLSPVPPITAEEGKNKKPVRGEEREGEKKMGNESGELTEAHSTNQWRNGEVSKTTREQCKLLFFSTNGSDDQREQHSRPENTFGTLKE